MKPPDKKKDTTKSCLSFWVSHRMAALRSSLIEMLGGSEFRLRQGFAYGKTLVTRHSARPPAGGICHVGKLQLRKKPQGLFIRRTCFFFASEPDSQRSRWRLCRLTDAAHPLRVLRWIPVRVEKRKYPNCPWFTKKDTTTVVSFRLSKKSSIAGLFRIYMVK